MPIRVIKVFVAICPVCGKRISCAGECEWDVWPTREELHEALEYGTETAETWDQRIAYSCGSACEVEYIKRRRAIRNGKRRGRPRDAAAPTSFRNVAPLI